MEDLLGIWQMDKKEIEDTLALSIKVKAEQKAGKINKSLENRTLVMVFEKNSTRTRISFETGMTQLGGHAIFMDATASQMSRGETAYDTGATLSRYADLVMARLYKHEHIVEMARGSSVPVINGLTDIEHPCQVLADLQTMKEHGKYGPGKKFVFVGDCGFNMANSLMLGCAKVGMDVVLLGPKNGAVNMKFVEEARKYGKVEIESDPAKALKGADVVYTDVWISMGQEKEKAEREKMFMPYQVNDKLMALAKPDAIFMHCLPAHRGYEVVDSVVDGKQSVVWDEAENRLHAQKAVMLKLMKKA